eukprot:18460-Rhodomonas_salina.4
MHAKVGGDKGIETRRERERDSETRGRALCWEWVSSLSFRVLGGHVGSGWRSRGPGGRRCSRRQRQGSR